MADKKKEKDGEDTPEYDEETKLLIAGLSLLIVLDIEADLSHVLPLLILQLRTCF